MDNRLDQRLLRSPFKSETHGQSAVRNWRAGMPAPFVPISNSIDWHHDLFRIPWAVMTFRCIASPQMTLLGKHIVVQGNRSDCNISAVLAQLNKFDTYEFLATLGELCCIKRSGRNLRMGHDIVPTYTFTDLVYLACYSHDESASIKPSHADIAALALTVHDTQRIDDTRSDGAIEYLQRLSAQQFDEQRESAYLIARTLLLYTEAWNKAPKAQRLVPDVLKSIEDCVGLPLVRYIRTGLYLSRFARASSRRIFTEAQNENPGIAQLGSDILSIIKRYTVTPQQLGLSITVDPTTGIHTVTDPLLIKRFPFVASRAGSSTSPDQGIAIPIPLLVLEKVTRGIYYDMTAKFSGRRKENIFRAAFGHAFQEYVYLVTKKTLAKSTVLSEYEQNDLRLKPVADLVVIEGRRATIIEIKQSNLFQTSRKTGHGDIILEDLKKNLCKSFDQLGQFYEALRNRKQPCAIYNSIEHFEYLVVTYEHLTWGNSFNRDHIVSSASRQHRSVDEKTHVVNIEEFENLLTHAAQEGLTNRLYEKRTLSDTFHQDFQDYLPTVCPFPPRNAYLTSVTESFIASFQETFTKKTPNN